MNKSNTRVDRGWGQMHSTLDVEMPQKKDRKKFLWFFFGAGLLLLVSALSLVNQLSSSSGIMSPIEIVTSENIPPKKSDSVSESNGSHSTTKQIITPTTINSVSENNNRSLQKAAEKKTQTNLNNINQEIKRNKIIDSEITVSSTQIIEDKNNSSLKSLITNTKKSDPLESFSAKRSVSDRIIISKSNKKSISTSSKLGHNTTLPQLAIPSISYSYIKTIGQDTELQISEAKLIEPIAKINQINKWGIGAYTSVGTDFFHKVNSLGAIVSAGVSLNRGKLSIGPSISYPMTKMGGSNSDIYIQSSDTNDVRLADDLNNSSEMDFNPIGLGAVEDSLYMDDLTAENNIRYISAGINIGYQLNSKWALHGGIGKEFHFGTQSLTPLDISNRLESLPLPPITFKHRNSYYIESGISYNISSKFSIATSYRYATSSLINIINDNRRSSKASLALRYNF